MAESNVTYLDLDEIVQPKIIIKYDGKEHELKQFTLADWIENTKDLQKHAATGETDRESESNIIINMIHRSFPTLTPDMMRNMALVKLNKILAFANGNNGTNDVNNEVRQQASANPLSAPEAAASS